MEGSTEKQTEHMIPALCLLFCWEGQGGNLDHLWGKKRVGS